MGYGKLVKYIPFADKALKKANNVVNEVKGFFRKQFSSFGKKNKGNHNKDKKEENPKSNVEKEPRNEPENEIKKNWTEVIEKDLGSAANEEVGKASGRSLGGLDKIENAPTSLPENAPDVEDKVEEIKEKKTIEKKFSDEIEKSGVEKSYEENIDKKIDQILDKGKEGEVKSWADKVRPDDNLEFQSLDQESNQSKAVELLREDSLKYFMPEGKDDPGLILNGDEQKKALELMSDQSDQTAKEILKENEQAKTNLNSKADAYKATIKSNDELREIEDGNFNDDVYRDQEATQEYYEDIDSDVGEDGSGSSMEMDFE